MRALYYYHYGPFHPVTYGADRVAVNQLDYLRKRGFTVDCVLPARTGKGPITDAFRERFAWLNSVTEIELPRYRASLAEVLFAYEAAATRPEVRRALSVPADLFLTNHLYTCPLVEAVDPRCKRLLETHDLVTRQFALVERHPDEAGLRVPPRNPLLAQRRDATLVKLETSLYQLFDAVMMISPEELHTVEALGVDNASFVPQMFPECERTAVPTSTGTATQFDLIFVGHANPFNIEGVTWFFENVYVPYLKKHRVRWALVGHVCDDLPFESPFISKLGVTSGPLDDLYAASKLVIAPIFEGTGIAIKTLEGLAMGRALVVTPCGARGLNPASGAFAQVDMKQDPAGAAATILRLLNAPTERVALQQRALDFMRRQFSRSAYYEAMDRVLATIGFDPARN